jgi:hypothetical protein
MTRVHQVNTKEDFLERCGIRRSKDGHEEVDPLQTHWDTMADPFVRIHDREKAVEIGQRFRDQIVASISSPFAEGFLGADLYPEDFSEEEYAWGLTYEKVEVQNASRKMRVLLVRVKSLCAMCGPSPTGATGLLANNEYFKRRWRNLWLLRLLVDAQVDEQCSSPKFKLEKRDRSNEPLKVLDGAYASALLVGRSLRLPVRKTFGVALAAAKVTTSAKSQLPCLAVSSQ